MHTALAFYLTIPFTPELKNIITPIISSLLKSYLNTNLSKNSSIDIDKLKNSISKTLEKIFTNKDLNNLIEKASADAIDIISKVFPATSSDLIQYRADLLKKFLEVTTGKGNTVQKFEDFLNAIDTLNEVATKYASNLKIRTLAQKLLQNIASTVYSKIDTARIEYDMVTELDKAYEKIKAEIERMYNELMKQTGDDEYSKLVSGIRKFFPQFSDVIPQIVVDDKEKEKIMKDLDKAIYDVRTKIRDFINMLEKTKKVLEKMEK